MAVKRIESHTYIYLKEEHVDEKSYNSRSI